jgi:hypothetical protein
MGKVEFKTKAADDNLLDSFHALVNDPEWRVDIGKRELRSILVRLDQEISESVFLFNQLIRANRVVLRLAETLFRYTKTQQKPEIGLSEALRDEQIDKTSSYRAYLVVCEDLENLSSEDVVCDLGSIIQRLRT